jgi:hypothetical protein
MSTAVLRIRGSPRRGGNWQRDAVNIYFQQRCAHMQCARVAVVVVVR